MDLTISIILFILIFGIIVLAHEYGHFLLAKVNGITVVEFSIGMGPTIASFYKKGTKYSIKLLPIGGACMFEGEDGKTYVDQEDQEKTSGVLKAEEKETVFKNQKEEDGLVSEKKNTGAFPDANVWARISTVVAGPVFNFILALLFAMIMLSFTTTSKAIITDTMEGYPAQEAGLQAGDLITSVNGAKVYLYSEVRLEAALNEGGSSMEITYVRDGEEYTTTIIPKLDEETGSYYMGVVGGDYFRPQGMQLFQYAYYEVRYCVKYTFKSLQMLISGQAGLNDLAGPVGMAQVVGETYTSAKSYGIGAIAASMMNIAILLSVNLGILNLLPLPALDGGRLIFLIIEVFRRKPVPPEKEGMVHFAGFVLLMLLMVVVFANDIMRLFS